MIRNPALGTNGGNTGPAFFATFFGAAIGLAFIIGVIIFIFMLISGAIQWIGSGGDKGALETAKSKVTNALIGIVVLFSVYAIIGLVSYFFGVNLLELTLSPIVPGGSFTDGLYTPPYQQYTTSP